MTTFDQTHLVPPMGLRVMVVERPRPCGTIKADKRIGVSVRRAMVKLQSASVKGFYCSTPYYHGGLNE